MGQSDVIEIHEWDGEVISWRRLSTRMAAFRRDFPPSQYQLAVSTEDVLAARPSLARLYEKALDGGHNPAELGLPPIERAARSMIFRAVLYDTEGRALESASAMRPILEEKDWEKGESAARQRLIAALGYHGELRDADESAEIGALGGRVEPASSTPTQEAATPSGGSGAEGTPSGSGGGDPGEAIPAAPAALIRQVQNQARLKGVEAPDCRTKTEAKQALKSLMERDPA